MLHNGPKDVLRWAYCSSNKRNVLMLFADKTKKSDSRSLFCCSMLNSLCLWFSWVKEKSVSHIKMKFFKKAKRRHKCVKLGSLRELGLFFIMLLCLHCDRLGALSVDGCGVSQSVLSSVYPESRMEGRSNLKIDGSPWHWWLVTPFRGPTV